MKSSHSGRPSPEAAVASLLLLGLALWLGGPRGGRRMLRIIAEDVELREARRSVVAEVEAS